MTTADCLSLKVRLCVRSSFSNKFTQKRFKINMPPRFQPPRQTPSSVKPLVLVSSGRPAKELGFKTVTQLNSAARGAKTPAPTAVKKIEGLVSGNAHHSVC